MKVTDTHERLRVRLLPFHEGHGSTIADWVQTAEQLLWLAPATEMPLTMEKVVGWTRPGGQAFILTCDGDETPLGYGELNPMRRQPRHIWLGHAIVRPDQRGRGIGKALIQALVGYAFDRIGADRISLIVFPENTAAVECYRRVGFVPVGQEYHQFGRSKQRHQFLRLEILPPPP